MDWQAYLTTKGYTGRRATGNEITYPCFFDCNEPSDSRKRKLYVNAETGLFSCKVCVSEGNHVTLMRHFGDDPKGDDPETTPTTGRRSEVLADAVDVGERTLMANDDVMEYLLGPRRGLNPETVVNRRLGYASKQWPLSKQLPAEKRYKKDDLVSAGILARRTDTVTGKPLEATEYEYFRDLVLIPYFDNGRCIQVRGKDIFGRYYTPIGDPVFFFNVDSLKGATEAILVEGEFDTMMLADLLSTSQDERTRNLAVIGLAGTGALPEDFDYRLGSLKRVFIATDPDGAGRQAAQKLKERLGERGIVVEWPPALLNQWIKDHGTGEQDKWGTDKSLADLDWTTWIHKVGASVHEVEEMFRPRGRLKSVMQALLGHRSRPTTGMKTGFTGLDSAFLPGLLPGQVFVLLAKTGVGKTVLLCNLAYNLRKRRVLFITLEMTAEEIWVRLARIYRFYNPFASDESIAQAYANLRICDSNRLDEEAFARLVEEYADDIGEAPEVAMVDYLGYYARGRRGGSQYEKTTDAIMQLKAEAKQHQFVVITPAQVNRLAQDGKPIDTDDARDSGAVEETADLMVGVWRADDALDTTGVGPGVPSGKLHMKILKSRHGNKDRVFLLQMGLMSLVVVDETASNAQKAARESHAVFQGQTYEQFLEQIRNTDPQLRK